MIFSVECSSHYSLSKIVYKPTILITTVTSRGHSSQLRVVLTHFSIRFDIGSSRIAPTWLSSQIGSGFCNVSPIQPDERKPPLIIVILVAN